MTDEEWRAVKGWEGLYEVSSFGRVRSLDRITPNGLTGGTSLIKGRVLKPKANRGGYLVVGLARSQKVQTKTIHRLVALEFIENPSELPLVLHGPNGKLDNSVGNLRWGTNSDNMYDKRRDGTDHMLNKTHCANGHEYTPENTVLDSGSRRCRICQRATALRRYWRGRNLELQRREALGIPAILRVARCEQCGRFLGKTHNCTKGTT